MTKKDDWPAPFYLFAAGEGCARTTAYRVVPLTDPHAPRRILFQRTLSGTNTFHLNGRRVRVSAGDLFIIDRHGPHTYAFEADDQPCAFDWVSIGYHDRDLALPRWLLENPIAHVGDEDELMHYYERAVAWRSQRPYYPDISHSLLAYQLLLSGISNSRPVNNRQPRQAVEVLKQELDDRFSESLTIKELAAEVGYRQETLTRQFQDKYATSPHAYLKRLRVQKACELIREGQLPLKQIAACCGFSSHNYFSRVFRQVIGQTPGDYRDQA